MSADSQHNWYVADYICDTLHIFSIDGTYLRSFSKDHWGIRVSGPYCAHVFQQHVYIGNDTDTISVFTTEGTHLKTFGGRGSAVGQIKNPYSITADENGLVCVVDN